MVFGIGSFRAFFNGFHDVFLGRADRVDGGAQIAMINVGRFGIQRADEGPQQQWIPIDGADGTASCIGRLVRMETAYGS